MDKQQKITILILGAVLLIALTVLFSVLFGREREIVVLDFEEPPFETDAVVGKPDVDVSLNYREINVNGNFVFSLCCIPIVEDNELVVYFSSSENNEPLLLIKVYDSKGEEIGKSGMLRAGEYVRSVTLSRIPEDSRVLIKVVSYEPETYYSRGMASATLEFVKKQ